MTVRQRDRLEDGGWVYRPGPDWWTRATPDGQQSMSPLARGWEYIHHGYEDQTSGGPVIRRGPFAEMLALADQDRDTAAAGAVTL